MKRLLYLLTLCLVLISLSLISYTFAIFETDAEGNSTMNIGKWQINLDNVDITNGEVTNVTLSNFIYTENNNVENGYIAPGRSGYYDIILDPGDTEVAIRFDVTISESSDDNANIEYNIDLLNESNIIQTGENTYTGIFSLEDIENGSNLGLRVNINWINNSLYDESDTEIGLVVDNTINVPISLVLTQYLGEEILPYDEE